MKSKILKTLLIIISIFAISISLSAHSIAEEAGTNLTEETSSQTENSNELNNEETNEENNEEESSEEEEEVVVTTRRLQSTPLRAQGSEGGEGEPQTIDYSLEINFKNQDGSNWDFDYYGNFSPIRITTSYEEGYLIPYDEVEYTYTWSNGNTGSGTATMGNNGAVNLNTVSTNPSNKVTVTLKNVRKGSLLWVTAADGKEYNNIEVEGHSYELFTMNPGFFGNVSAVIDLQENETTKIDMYKGDDPVILKAKFINPDGTVRMFEEGENIPDISRSLYRENLEYWNYDKETGIFTRRFYPGDDDELKVHWISLDEGNCIEKLVVDGEELSNPDNKEKILDTTPGNVINLDYYMAPRVVTGTVGFYSYDGSITDDYVYSFYFHLMQGASSSYDVTEEDIENAYWTIEGDETKHYGENGGFNVTIPIGKKVTLHNIPIYAMFHMASGWPLDNITWTHFTGENRNRTYVTYKGEDIREYASESYCNTEELGIIPQIFWNYTLQHEAPSIHETYIDTSGSFYYFNLNDGFDINYYLFRTTTQFMIKKELKEDASIEENKKYHFKINLKDQKTGLPFTEKVAYYIYSDSESTVNPDEDVQYAMPDEDGNIDIYLGAGEYARIGRSKPSDYEMNLYYGAGEKRRPDELYVKRIYVPGIGMLPSYIDYKIVEIDDGYSYTVSPENGEEGTSETPFWKNDSIYSRERDIINGAGEVTYPAYNAQQMFEYLDGIIFTNSRIFVMIYVVRK